jgi:hypothetical protein
MGHSSERKKLGDNHIVDSKNVRDNPCTSKLVSEKSRTMKWTIQQYKPMQVRTHEVLLLISIGLVWISLILSMLQVWDWLFKSCEVNGQILLRDGLITLKDIEECILKGNCKKLGIQLPAWSILQCLLESAKSNSSGLVICMSLKLLFLHTHKYQQVQS